MARKRAEFRYVGDSLSQHLIEIERSIPPLVDRMAIDIGEELKDDVQRRTPVSSGKLKESITLSVMGEAAAEGAATIRVFTDLDYAPYVEWNTGKFHNGIPIRPKNAKALSWIDPKTGKRVYAKEVSGTVGVFMFSKAEVAIERQMVQMGITNRVRHRWSRRHS